MHFGVFTYKPRSKYVFTLEVLLILLVQIIAWIIRSNYDLYNYNNCSYSMQGVTSCPDNSNNQCILSASDCDAAQWIVVNHLSTIILYLSSSAFVVVFTVLQYCFNWSDCILLSPGIISVNYLFSLIFLFRNLALIASIKQKDLVVNSFVDNMAISLCILCFIIALLAYIIYLDLKDYLEAEDLKAQNKKDQQIQAKENVEQLMTQKQNLGQRESMIQIQNEELDLQNKHYQPIINIQPVPDRKCTIYPILGS